MIIIGDLFYLMYGRLAGRSVTRMIPFHVNFLHYRYNETPVTTFLYSILFTEFSVIHAFVSVY